MNEIRRFVVVNKNGNYLRETVDDLKPVVNVEYVDHPNDASLFKTKGIAKMVVKSILNKEKTTLPIIWDEDNPPSHVEEILIKCQPVRRIEV